MRSALASLDDPLENPHVVSKSGPEEFSLGTLPEPVHVEDAWKMLHQPAHLEPVSKVIPHVIAAEWQHGHRIAAHLTDRPRSGRGHFGSDGGSEIDAVNPVEGLEDQRHRRCTASTEDHGADPHPFGIFPVGIDDRAVFCRCGESAVGMAREDRFALGVELAWFPILPLPVDEMRGSLFGHSLPPDVTVVGEGDVCEDRIGADGIHGHRVTFVGGAWGDTEEACLGVDGSQPAIRSGLDPGNVVADAGDFPAFLAEMPGRDDHGEVGLAAGAWEGRCDVGFLS